MQTNGSAALRRATKDARRKLLDHFIGLKEVPGPISNPEHQWRSSEAWVASQGWT